MQDIAGKALGGLAVALLLAVSMGAHRLGAAARPDPPLLVPWSRIGDIALGESMARVGREYGRETRDGYYRLHGTKVWVTSRGGRVDDIDFKTPYYRTKTGFGVGSTIPLGPCRRTWLSRCGHLWHGFVWNLRLRELPCGCWTKVGLGARSLPATGTNFLKPWFIIYVKHGRVTEFYFSLHYID